MALGCCLAWPALALPPVGPGAGVERPVVTVAGGIDIVRIPQPARKEEKKAPPPSKEQQASPQPPPTPPPPTPSPKERVPEQALGRFQKVSVRLGAQPNDPQRGWLGVRMDPVELPLALSLGLVDTRGALIVEATQGGPAAQAGVRFGDIIVSIDGTPIQGMGELRQRVSAAAAGNEMVLEVWRTASDDGDFAQTLRRLADGGNAYIMFRLGRMYATGVGVPRDDLEAVRWYRKGASAGNLAATTALGYMTLEGRGTNKDPLEGIRLLKDAADRGHPDAMHTLGLAYLEGRHVGKDGLEAARLFTGAGEAGHAQAMVDLGLMYDSGSSGVPQDFLKAAHWYRRAADLGNAAGMVNLGFLHARGKGVDQNDATAVSWYRKAAAEGNPAGIHNLAAMADNGRGIERDPELAASLMLQALDMRYDFSYRQMTQTPGNWTREFRRALQRKLREAGFYSGSIDGEIGSSTVAAIDAYVARQR